MSLVWTLWRWLRLPLIVLAVLALGLVTWVAWILTDQRYQQFFTQQLSELLDAEVNVKMSHLTLWRGLGIKLDTVTVREQTSSTPFFTAAAVDLFLDISSLLRGQFVFRQIAVIKPELHIIAGVTQDAIVRRLRQDRRQKQSSSDRSTVPFAPRFTVQSLTVEDGLLIYRRATASPPLHLTSLDASLMYSEQEAITIQLETSLGQRADLGSLTLSARTLQAHSQLPFPQRQWQGEIFLTGTRVRQLGQLVGNTWPLAVVDFSGRYHGQWSGPLELSGTVNLQEAHIGTSKISGGRLHVEKLFWPGPQGQQSLSAWKSIRQTLQMSAQIAGLHGLVGEHALPCSLQKGTVTFANETLTVTQIHGYVGNNSRLVDGTVTVNQLFGPPNPELALQFTVRIDLAKDADAVLAMVPTITDKAPLPQIAQPQGGMSVKLHIASDLGGKQSAQYTGEVTSHDVAFRLPAQNVSVANLNGVVQVTPKTLTISSLTGKVDAAPVTAQGKIHQYQSNQRQGELQLTFSDMSDHTVAPFFPERVILANKGTLSGKVTVAFSADKPLWTTGTVQFRGVQLDPLRFLHPFTIAAGELRWQEQSGTFTVTKGRLVDFTFTGNGRFSSVKPLRLELALDFPTLNVQHAIDIDPPRATVPSPKPANVIKANLTCGECTYKTALAHRLRVAVHWHDRQAEVDVASAAIAGGSVQGQVTVWPDLRALFFAPQIASVNVQDFFRTIGVSTDVLTGNATGNGKVYVEDWRRWANPAYWDAVWSLNIVDGIARRVPILVRLWSALSLQGILRLQVPELPSEGLPFSTLTGNLAFGRGLAVTKDVSLNGSAVRIDASGELRLQARTVDLLVQLVLLHGVTSALEWVPLIGELLARGTDILTTLPFRVTGPYADPTVTSVIIGTG